MGPSAGLSCLPLPSYCNRGRMGWRDRTLDCPALRLAWGWLQPSFLSSRGGCCFPQELDADHSGAITAEELLNYFGCLTEGACCQSKGRVV